MNLLEARGVTLASSSAGYLDSGVATTFAYIELTELAPAGYGSDVGLPSGATVYRLETLNLLPDGDFEASTVGVPPDGWDLIGSPSEFRVLDAPMDPAFGTGSYLSFNVGAPGTGGRINLDNLHYSIVGNATYHIQFEVIRRSDAAELLLDYGNDDPISPVSYLTLFLGSAAWYFRQDGEPPVLERFPGVKDLFDRSPLFYSSPTGPDFLYVGSPTQSQGSNGFADNIRIGRLDNLPHWRLPVAAEHDGALDLVPGRYRFRLFVKSEIDAQVTPAPAGLNRFRSDQITIGIDNSFRTYAGADYSISSGGWTEIISSFRLTTADLAGAPTIAIQITPSGLDSPAVGSILIAAPRLELEW